MSMRWSSRRTLYGTGGTSGPTCSRAIRGSGAAGGGLRPMKVSPGAISALNAAMLADAPECGWTFTNLHPKSFVTRSIARFSATSTYWQPP
jgi:hypothetical protein